jgi:hypothetical protein
MMWRYFLAGLFFGAGLPLEGDNKVPHTPHERVNKTAHNTNKRVLPEEDNPVNTLVVTGHEGEVCMDEIPENAVGASDNNNNNNNNGTFVDMPL